jgi:hypothetical protein
MPAQAPLVVDRDPVAMPVILGDWQFEIRGDEIAVLKHRGVSVLRAIRFVVRDQDWRTVPANVLAIARPGTAGASGLSLDLEFDAWGISLSGTLSIAPDGDRLAVSVDVVAGSAFATNRVGLVVLHHPDDAGSSAVVGQPDGSQLRGQFPVRINPHQPFTAIRHFSWNRRDTEMTLDFEGEIFEMEDQRNWTDASFKTYSRPLSLPYPYRVGNGERIQQKVVVGVLGAGHVDVLPPIRVLMPTEPGTTVPSLGTLLENGTGARSLTGWGLGFLQVEVDLGSADAASTLDHAVSEARALALPLDLRVVAHHTSATLAADLHELAARVPEGDLARLAVFDPTTHVSEGTLVAAAVAAAETRRDATVIVGTRAHFTELNRTADRLLPGGHPVTFSLTPTMHSYEIAHVKDSLATHEAIARQAAEVAEESDIHVGPITLEARFNAVSTADHPSDEFAIDDRGLYSHPAVPSWVFATIVQLASPDTASVSIFRASGYRGLVAEDAPGAVATAAGHIVRRLAELTGATIRSRYRDDEIQAAVIADRLFVANLTDHAVTVELGVESASKTVSVPGWGLVETSAM